MLNLLKKHEVYIPEFAGDFQGGKWHHSLHQTAQSMWWWSGIETGVIEL